MRNTKIKISPLAIAIALLSTAITTVPAYGRTSRTQKPITFQTKSLQDKTAKKYTSQLTNEEEKLENLENDPKTTEEQIIKQKKKVKTLRERVTKWMNRTYTSITEMSTPAKVLLATLGITGIAVATDYAMGTGYTSSALSTIGEWASQGMQKGREYLGWLPEIGTPEYEALREKQLKKLEADFEQLEKQGKINSYGDVIEFLKQAVHKYPLIVPKNEKNTTVEQLQTITQKLHETDIYNIPLLQKNKNP